jgi:hypothetical protein
VGNFFLTHNKTHKRRPKAYKTTFVAAAICFAALTTGCPLSQTPKNNATATEAALVAPSPSASASSSATVTSGPNAVQIIFATGASGSFDAVAVPAAGGTYAKVSRVFDLNGNTISNFSSTYPNWWFRTAAVFLTSTSTSFPAGGAGATTSNTTDRERTPCAYFDTYDDNNPESNGSYTIDGLIPNAQSLSDLTPAADIDQCAGITVAERSKLGFYAVLRRGSSSMGTTDKIQMIVRAKPLTPPNTAPVPSSCIVGGLFDATACATNVFTVSMRTAIGAAARPFYMLMPSAKSMDLVSESVLLPVNIDSTLTTITLDRLKGGAIIYSVILIKVP